MPQIVEIRLNDQDGLYIKAADGREAKVSQSEAATMTAAEIASAIVTAIGENQLRPECLIITCDGTGRMTNAEIINVEV